MTWESDEERRNLADDRDALWGAWPRSGGEVRIEMSDTTPKNIESKQQAWSAFFNGPYKKAVEKHYDEDAGWTPGLVFGLREVAAYSFRTGWDSRDEEVATLKALLRECQHHMVRVMPVEDGVSLHERITMQLGDEPHTEEGKDGAHE